MILSNAIHVAYNKLYEQLRRYLWDMDTVEQIAKLEVETYKAVPSLSSVRRALETLHTNIRDTAKEDPELQEAIQLFRSTLDSASDICCKLETVREDVTV